MARLKKTEGYVVAVNHGAGTYKIRVLDYADGWSNENPNGWRFAALFPFCNCYEFNTMKEVNKFCSELKREGFTEII